MKKFNIFYSWQSDLPGNKTRSFIRECIDEAIELAEESEAIEAVRDEATKDTTGSPNIVTTLFSKIDDCDLFIADISLCYTENQKGDKKGPNPNVLLELGYAVKTLGWDRVICLCNVDYGNDYPFDIAHNRITDFSLKSNTKNEVKSELSKIIFTNIRDIRKLKPRAKNGMALHILGSYNFEEKTVIDKLIPITLNEQEGFVLHNAELLDDAKKLVDEIRELSTKIEIKKVEPKSIATSPTTIKMDSIEQISKMLNGFETAVEWKDMEEDRHRIAHWLGIEVSEEFFDIGNLIRVTKTIYPFNTDISFKGTPEEKEKYEKLQQLSSKLLNLDVRNNYIKTFDGMTFIPLAIQNISTTLDEDIHIVVNIEKGEIVEPNEHLILSDYEGLQGLLCRDDDDENDVGVICELFCPNEDGIIHIEELPFNLARDIPKNPIITANGLSQPDKDENDYALELQEFIALSANGNNYYEFNIESLRPNECKWLCCGMLLKPIDDEIVINYQIHSKHSTGDISGKFEIEL